MEKVILILGLILIILAVVFYSFRVLEGQKVPISPEASASISIETLITNSIGEYNPTVNPADFTTKINNKYFTLEPGRRYVYELKTGEGLERIEILVLDRTKDILGVKTLGVRDTVTLDGQLIEDTYDWFAQHKDGSVWYFGEDVDNYEDGRLRNHEGAWMAGLDGAQPGINMKATPQAGDSYRQEYYKGQAEDMADVVDINKTVTVGGKTYTNCLQTRDWSQIETDLNEYKYYCPEVGFLVAGHPVNNPSEKLELINIVID